MNVLQRRNLEMTDEVKRLNEQLTSPATTDRFTQLRIGVLNPTPDGSPRAVGVSVWDIAEQRGVLILENLPVLPSTQDYQLWLLGDPKIAGPVNAGVVGVDERGNARVQFRTAVLVDAAERFAISVERKGGVPAPQGKIVMLSN